MWNHNNYSRKFWDNSKCKCDQGKAILDGKEIRVSKIIYKDICIKVCRLWGWGVVSITQHLKVYNCRKCVFNDLETHKSQIFTMIALRGVAKLSTSPKVTISPPPVPYHFISDQCLNGDRWSTLFLGNSIVAIDL